VAEEILVRYRPITGSLDCTGHQRGGSSKCVVEEDGKNGGDGEYLDKVGEEVCERIVNGFEPIESLR
jgi:hypothetical protein